MRPLVILFAVVSLVAGSSGCQTCGDRPRLLDRLFHRDRDDCPSKSSRDGASAVKPCSDVATRGGCGDAPGVSMGAPMVPSGYAQLHSTPVSSSMPIYGSAPFTAFPSTGGPSFNAPPRDNELPMPGDRIRQLDVPTGPLAPTSPANPNVSGPTFANPGRFTGDARK